MTTESNATRELFRKFFLRTFAEGEVRVTCVSAGVATNTRFQAYHYARWARKHRAADTALMKAIDEVSLSCEGEVLIGRLKANYVGLQAIANALGEVAPGAGDTVSSTPAHDIPPEPPEARMGEAERASLARIEAMLREPSESVQLATERAEALAGSKSSEWVKKYGRES